MNIAVLSDTHGILRPEAAAILRNCDAALHAGDIDTPETLGQIRAALKPGVPFYVVRGNNDREWVRELPEYAAFSLGGIRFYMAHRKKDIPEDLGDRQIIIYGHSHRYAEEIRDHRLWLNPGNHSAVAVLGMVVGAAFCHNFSLASSTAGPTLNGKIAVILGLVVCTVIGLLNRQKAE